MDADYDSTAPKIVYPCLWVYAIIGSDEALLRAGILAVAHGRTHTLEFSRRSATHRYCSFHLELRVDTEAERNFFYEELKKIPSVKMVL